jgi:hypothetical protein
MFRSSRHPTERTAYIRHPRRFELPQIVQDRSTDNSEELTRIAPTNLEKQPNTLFQPF